MSLGRELKRRGRIMIAPTIFLAITAYFGWNATQGDRGLVAYAQRQDLLRQVVADQNAAKAERDAWETRVSGLRARHLDPDTLDERARAMLNLADPNDVIVKLGAQEKLSIAKWYTVELKSLRTLTEYSRKNVPWNPLQYDIMDR